MVQSPGSTKQPDTPGVEVQGIVVLVEVLVVVVMLVEVLVLVEDVGGGMIGSGSPQWASVHVGASPSPTSITRHTLVIEAFQRRAGQWLLVPIHHIFGSEELSRMAPAIAELSPVASLFLNKTDAAELGFDDGAGVAVRIDRREVRLTVKVRAELPGGVAGYSAGYAQTAGIVPLEWARIEKVTP
jgi:NADH-quinone oxidoreductase subunit G